MVEEICIIGGGAGGLISCKIAMDYGLTPVVLEKSSWLGGIWRNPNDEIGVWNSLSTNTSKYFTCFSDMPWPSATSPTPTNREVMDYFIAYARAHALIDNFLFNCKAIYVNKIHSGYLVRWQNVSSGQIFEKEFPYVIIANGFHAKELFPISNLCHLSKLKVLHSGKYRDPKPFIGQKVAVIGASTSACDIAEDLSSHAGEVIQIVREPHRLLPKYYQGIPIDFFIKSKSLERPLASLSPEEIGKEIDKGFVLLAGHPGHHNLVVPNEDHNSSFFSIVNNNYKKCLEENKIQIQKGKLRSLNESGLVLENGNEVEADAVIVCTGFEVDLTFLDEKILEIINYDGHDNVIPITGFLNTIHPDLPGLGFVGLFRGVFIGTYELQAELIIRHFKHLVAVSERALREGVGYELRLRRSTPKPQFIYYSLEFTERLMEVLNFQSSAATSDHQEIIKLRDILYLPQFYRLDKGESQFILCKQVIDELKERFSIDENTLINLFYQNKLN
ncbi:unnamed protein product [Blepharisma stoltei]|uniref:Flavin-containing monooxygenase n=1 Tax=Blepharisma stoltei TaxID=1481888 RepID=A0AAU9J3R3_9CILI|nr:unnamed protein product [Blepharisma stoltei]